mmetsp:Transcript_9300/g.14227  ORF Transcript_9300/g.14227 Transcript_9300/m.14227 type:complete len:84 (-) Transcript_9300:1948-2199(-)
MVLIRGGRAKHTLDSRSTNFCDQCDPTPTPGGILQSEHDTGQPTQAGMQEGSTPHGRPTEKVGKGCLRCILGRCTIMKCHIWL